MDPHSNNSGLDHHREKFAFYYSNALPMEAMGADMAGSFRRSLTALRSAKLENLPEDFVWALKKSVQAMEEAYVVAVGEIRKGPTYLSLSEAQRAVMETGCLQFNPRT